MDGKTLFSSVGVLALVVIGVVAVHNRVSSEDQLVVADEVTKAPMRAVKDSGSERSSNELHAEIERLHEQLARSSQTDANDPKEPAAANAVGVFQLAFAEAEGVAEALRTVLPDVQLCVQPEENRLVVSLGRDQIEQVSQTIKTLDQPRRQVQVTGYLFEVGGDDIARLDLARQAAQSEGVTASLGKIAELQSMIETLTESKATRLLARPNIRVYDRVEASFQSVQEIPVPQTVTTERGSVGTTEFREAGVSLHVLPSISTDGTILMQVSPEYSTVQGQVGDQPIINRCAATTTVKVEDGEPIVISGVRTTSNTSDGQSETELLVILKVEIVANRAAATH